MSKKPKINYNLESMSKTINIIHNNQSKDVLIRMQIQNKPCMYIS